jgi:hypothetical protein
MPIEQSQLFSSINFPLAVKAVLVLLLVFNLIFSLLVFRQTQLIGKRLPTPLVPFLRFAATIYIGLSAAMLLLVIGGF